MNKTFKYLVIVSLGIFCSCQQRPAEYYVSVNGDDMAPGTREKPVKTISKASELSLSVAGKREVHIIIGDGTHYLPSTLLLTPEHSGSEKHPVIYRAENEGGAIISGGQELDLEWEPYRDGIFKAALDEDLYMDQLYVNGSRQRMARFPDAEAGKNVFDTWELLHTREPDPANDPLDPFRVASWNNPKGAYIHAMHKALWGDMHWLVTGRDEGGKLEMEGGWQNNRPSPMHPRYRMVENVFEELDKPGEWYYNRDEQVLYYFPEPGTKIERARVEIVRLKHLVEFNGTMENPVRFIRMEGLVFRHTARTFMENREQLLRSDWTCYRGGGIIFKGAEDCTISGCEFDQLGGNSIFVNNYNRGIEIKSCYIHHSGANGIAFVGDPSSVRSPLFRYGKQDFANMDREPGPRGDNYPRECMVDDCLITMTGRDEKQTSPVQISMSYKITVSHCSIYDVPRAGINISEGTFGGHIIEYCDVFNTVLETGDHGSFNSWGRDRFWTPDGKETHREVLLDPGLPKLDMLAPNIIRNSRWRCDHGWDIDLGDDSSWYLLYNNVLLNGGLKMREGYDRAATNNIILNNSLHPHVWYPESGDVFKSNIVFGAYRPAVMARVIAGDGKWGLQLDSNLFASSEADRLKYALNGCDPNSVSGDPLFLDISRGDYRVDDDSPALTMGFVNFPMDLFGVRSDKLKKMAKQPKLPQTLKIGNTKTGEVHKWKGADIKNVETLGEQSANGLSSMSGVMLLTVPEGSDLASRGFRTGDVILGSGDGEIKTFDHLQRVIKSLPVEDTLVLEIMRNQHKEKIAFKK